MNQQVKWTNRFDWYDQYFISQELAGLSRLICPLKPKQELLIVCVALILVPCTKLARNKRTAKWAESHANHEMSHMVTLTRDTRWPPCRNSTSLCGVTFTSNYAFMDNDDDQTMENLMTPSALKGKGKAPQVLEEQDLDNLPW
jgi:hypothetical protein